MADNLYAESMEAVFESVDSAEEGLSDPEARNRLEELGRNELERTGGVNPWRVLFEQTKDFFVILLFAASVIEISLGLYHLGNGGVYDLLGGSLIVIIVLFIIGLGFYQEYNAEKELEALKEILTPTATVVRDGEVKEIPASNLVPGDVMVVESGDRIPADGRIFNCVDLKVNESALTGESVSVTKDTGRLSKPTPLGDRANMLYMGTTATYGRATAVVTATGMGTELGTIAGEVQGVQREPTPLQRQMDDLGREIGIAVVFISFVVFLALLISNWGGLGINLLLHMFMIAVALAVAAVPEALPGVVTIGLSLGTRRMAQKNALIRKLPAVETLGSTTVIASDKTGTLTKNEMTVRKAYIGGEEVTVTGQGYDPEGELRGDVTEEGLEKLLQVAVLCNDSNLEKKEESRGGWSVIGEPTEGSLLVLGLKAGLEKKEMESRFPRVGEIPFSSSRKRMTTIHEVEGERVAYTKGAADVVLDRCSKIWQEGEVQALDGDVRERILAKQDEFASAALRVLALAYRPLPEEEMEEEEIEEDLIFLGLVGMRDPARSEAKEAVQKCKSAGIRPIMITGDHQVTARAVAREVGIYGEKDRILTGRELEDLSEEELRDVVDEVSVYARVSPQHKLDIVNALKDQGEVVAMTGDGVNDAPSLKKADIGIAMGITGTDVSKEASDMVLLDDNFASIVAAVEEGRGVYGNIKKYFAYLISGNIGEVAILFLSIVLAPWLLGTFFDISTEVPLALTTIQILMINLITDGLPAIALSWDPFEPNAMKRPPRDPQEPIYAGLEHFLLWYPVIMIGTMFSLFLYVFGITENVFLTQTVTFLSITLFEAGQAFACRSIRYPSLKVGMFKNRKLILAVIASLTFVLGLIYSPNFSFSVAGSAVGLKELLHFSSPPLTLLAAVILSSSLGFLYLETAKYFRGEKL